MPSISLATIYNCLEALVDWGLVKQVNLDRAPTRYCANLLEHSHFYCESCGAISDVETPFNGTWNLPPGFVVAQAEVSLRGLCVKCSAERASDVGDQQGSGASPFHSSKLNWSDLNQPRAIRMLALYRALLSTRRKHLFPLLPKFTQGGRSTILGEHAVQVTWQADTAELILTANLADHAQPRVAIPSGETLWQEGTVAASGEMSPWFVRWTLNVTG